MHDCIFCSIISGAIPADTVYENDKVKVFRDINPVAPVHLVIVPKTHIENINKLNDKNSDIAGDCMLAAKESAKITGVSESGYRIISNCGKDAGQSVGHLHFHLIGGMEFGEKIL